MISFQIRINYWVPYLVLLPLFNTLFIRWRWEISHIPAASPSTQPLMRATAARFEVISHHHTLKSQLKISDWNLKSLSFLPFFCTVLLLCVWDSCAVPAVDGSIRALQCHLEGFRKLGTVSGWHSSLHLRIMKTECWPAIYLKWSSDCIFQIWETMQLAIVFLTSVCMLENLYSF